LAWAVSPLAVWYAREARPYALMTLLVAASYLALVAILRRGRRRWLVAYLGATTLALYTEESALFALAPQVAVLLGAARRDRRQAAALLGAGLGALLLYLPWLPQLARAAPATSSQAQFALTPAALAGALRAVVGL